LKSKAINFAAGWLMNIEFYEECQVRQIFVEKSVFNKI